MSELYDGFGNKTKLSEDVDKLKNDKADKTTINSMWKFMQGQIWEWEEQLNNEYTISIKSTSGTVKGDAIINQIGGATIVDNDIFKSAVVDKIVSSIGVEISIPESVRNLCPDYGISINNYYYNYIDFSEKKYYRKVKSISLSALNLKYNSSWVAWMCDIPDMMNATNIAQQPVKHFICDKFVNAQNYNQFTLNCIYSFDAVKNTIFIKNGSTTIKPSGTLYYKLKTNEVIDLSEVLTDDFTIPVEDGGTLIFHNENQIPVPTKITYCIKLGGNS